ncbi:hypothetical protein ACPOL_0893 [Acidisarcina polymorpha]|uniref:Uncharacterized protein n=1 Tax=Acidisarcina polymorpha TaxID=2211140 RepID=A0A2Z5FTW8_9BACT|nr:hypothetical protein ACPOL_0893 [Acidisarcina polymorpha]
MPDSLLRQSLRRMIRITSSPLIVAAAALTSVLFWLESYSKVLYHPNSDGNLRLR